MPRPSDDFQRRMSLVLARHAPKPDEEADFARLFKAARLAGALAGAVAMFLALKGVALATSDRPFHPAPPPEAGIAAHLQFWLSGADPVARAVASVIRGPRPAAAGIAASATSQAALQAAPMASSPAAAPTSPVSAPGSTPAPAGLAWTAAGN